jgi:hypothetical protein
MRRGGAGTKASTPQLRFAKDLLRSERIAFVVMQRIGFGRIESLRVQHGELVLNPWPRTIRDVKFASETATSQGFSDEVELKGQIIEFFGYVRAMDSGEILSLEIRHGMPFAMKVVDPPELRGEDLV